MTNLREQAIEYAGLMAGPGEPVDPHRYAHLDDTPLSAPPAHYAERFDGQLVSGVRRDLPPGDYDPAEHEHCAKCVTWEQRYGPISTGSATGTHPRDAGTSERPPGEHHQQPPPTGPAALAEQQLVFAATRSGLRDPDDVTRFLRPEDFMSPEGRVDAASVDAAVAGLLRARPYLAGFVEGGRAAGPGSGQGAGQGESAEQAMERQVAAATALMNDPRGWLVR